jgi:hypothetical protein
MGLKGVEQNNPSGDAAEFGNNHIVFFNALMVLQALDDFSQDNNNNDTSTTALGLLADGSNAVALTPVGHLVDGIDAPPALGEMQMPRAQVPVVSMGTLLATAPQAVMALLAFRSMGAQHHWHLPPLLLFLVEGALPP